MVDATDLSNRRATRTLVSAMANGGQLISPFVRARAGRIPIHSESPSPD